MEDLIRLIRDALGQLAGLAGVTPGRKTVGEQAALFVGGTLADLLQRLADRVADRPEPPDPTLQGKGLAETLQSIIAVALSNPERFAQQYARFAEEALAILEGKSDIAPEPKDFRFKDPLWQDSAFLRTLLQLYLGWERSMQNWVADAPVADADRRRIRFVFEQSIAALAPSNLPLNPAALRRALSTRGESVVTGVQHWVEDALDNRFMPRQIRPGAYQVGRDLAVTPGAVVYRNEVLEVIQYTPQTPLVRRRPVLLLAAQINKYYAFDLRPQNSLIAHVVRAGIQFFAVSWRNPSRAEADWGLDTYVRAVLGATEAVCRITGSETLGLISACAGGLTAMALVGYLAEHGERRIANHSLLVTCLFPGEGSDIELFATPALFDQLRATVREDGVMEGEDLTKAFFWLRPTDLVWRFWINNYLLGKEPPRLDVLHWDNDSTRLPAALHSDFIDMFKRDVFRNPGALRVLGRDIDFRKVAIGSYFVGGEEDYMMPWRGCYRASQVFRGRHKFVLSISGHVQSLLRPPRVANKYFYADGVRGGTPDDWLRTATRHDGSWWGHWHQWLNAMSGELKPAPTELGNAYYPPLTPAPGDYVLG